MTIKCIRMTFSLALLLMMPEQNHNVTTHRSKISKEYCFSIIALDLNKSLE